MLELVVVTPVQVRVFLLLAAHHEVYVGQGAVVGLYRPVRSVERPGVPHALQPTLALLRVQVVCRVFYALSCFGGSVDYPGHGFEH